MGIATRRLGSWLTLLLVSGALLAGCSTYQPLDRRPGQSWADARAAAQSRAEAMRRAGGIVSVDAQGNIHHLVLPGDTVSGLAQFYGSSTRAIATRNRLRSADRIYAGQMLVIPAATAVAAGTSAQPPAPSAQRHVAVRPPPARPGASVAVAGAGAAAPPSRPAPLAPQAPQRQPELAPAPVALAVPPPTAAQAGRAAEPPPPLSGEGFLWPVAGPVIDGFGDKPNGYRNDGVNLAAPAGAPVRAAEHGIVVYAGSEIAGFGNMLLIRHADDFLTAYAHLDAVVVAVGDRVARGATIGTVGTTGAVTTPQLHFELRSGRRAVDPERVLRGGPTTVAQGRSATPG